MNETTTAQTMAVLAELVLMATRDNLPMPMYMTASEKNSQLNLTLNNRADLDAWHQVFGGGRLWECAPTETSPTVLVTNMHSGSLLGWSVNLQANVPPPLSTEVLAALGEAARSDAAAVLVGETVAVLDEPKGPREFDDAHGCTWRENGEWLTLLDANDKDSGLIKTRAFVEQHYGPLVGVPAPVDDCTCDLNLRKVCETCRGAS